MTDTSDASEKKEHHHRVRIHIDEKSHESPNPTTGEALYALGEVKHGLELFREVDGDREDPGVDRGPETIHLKEDEHFHSGPPREITIIVNTRKKKVTATKLAFIEVVALAYQPVRTDPKVLYTVTYGRGPKANPEGELLAGHTVKLKDGMVFLVTETDKS